jgi:hypothetical protein
MEKRDAFASCESRLCAFRTEGRHVETFCVVFV